jgi:predicted nucleic acid-binding protein
VPRLVVDTGFLVALYRRRDALHADALAFLRGNRAGLVTASPVIAEACYFLGTRAKVELLDWVSKGGLTVAEVPVEAYPDLGRLLTRYASLDVDFTDVALLWLAELLGEHRILTVDERDFAAFGLKGKRRFQLVQWHQQ